MKSLSKILLATCLTLMAIVVSAETFAYSYEQPAFEISLIDAEPAGKPLAADNAAVTFVAIDPHQCIPAGVSDDSATASKITIHGPGLAHLVYIKHQAHDPVLRIAALKGNHSAPLNSRGSPGAQTAPGTHWF